MLEDLAELCNISTSHFIRLFKKQLHCTPHEYILLYRIRQSKNLLISSSYNIEDIAEMCGFNSPSHFARAFKKINILTPTEFRSVQF
jgi:AraC-like DNA-binding protein